MRGRKSVFACLAFLFTFFTGTAIAQQCSHVAGSWVDKYGYAWSLTQSGGTAQGSVDTDYCGVWDAGGTMSNGHFSLSAYNPNYPGPNPYCGEWFEYVGDLEVGGCNVGEGAWTNPEISGQSFWWDKACAVPAGETTHASLWYWTDQFGVPGPDATFFRFRGDVPNAGGGDLSGREITEIEIGVTDYCKEWDPNSPWPEAGLSGGDWTLSADNTYPDTIGWFPDPIEDYRAAGVAPCAAVINQRMKIACNAHGVFGTSTSWVGYEDNALVLYIGASPGDQIANERDQVLHPKVWP